MVDKLIAPQRGEELTPSGKATNRFSYYLEENSSQTNASTELTEADPSSINMSSAQLSSVKKMISAIVNDMALSQEGAINKLNKRIEQLENTITANQNNTKKFAQLENDFIAPFYKTRYDKLTIKKVLADQLILPQVDDASSPSIQFGDGTDGFYNQANGIVAVSIAGIKRFSFKAAHFRSSATNGSALMFVTPSDTVPSIVPNVNDTNTGVGWNGGNVLSLIADGVEGLRVRPTEIVVPTGNWDNTGINIDSGDVYKINGTTVLSSNTLGSGVTASSLTSVGILINVNTSGVYSVDGSQVLSNRRTGWAATTGTELRTNFGDASLSDTSQVLRALIVDLKAHMMIGA